MKYLIETFSAHVWAAYIFLDQIDVQKFHVGLNQLCDWNPGALIESVKFSGSKWHFCPWEICDELCILYDPTLFMLLIVFRSYHCKKSYISFWKKKYLHFQTVLIPILQRPLRNQNLWSPLPHKPIIRKADPSLEKRGLNYVLPVFVQVCLLNQFRIFVSIFWWW